MINKIKLKLQDARFFKNKELINLYSTLLGEIQSLESSKNKSLSLEECENIVKKFISNNNQVLVIIEGDSKQNYKTVLLKAENSCLQQLLPKYLTKEEIHAIILSDLDVTGKPLGQMIGLCMKHFKSLGKPVEGKDVKEVLSGFDFSGQMKPSSLSKVVAESKHLQE